MRGRILPGLLAAATGALRFNSRPSGAPSRRRRARWPTASTLLVAVVLAGTLLAGAAGTASSAAPKAVASGWTYFKYPGGQPLCTQSAFRGAYFARADCGYGDVSITGTTSTSAVFIDLYGPDGTKFASQRPTFRSGTTWRYLITPSTSWPAGVVTVRARLGGDLAGGGEQAAGEGAFSHNQLGAGLAAASRSQGYAPGDAIPLSGTIHESKSVLADTTKTPVPASFSIRVVTATGEVRGPYGPFTANKSGAGQVSETLPPAATAGLTATADTNFETTISLEVDASYTDASTGQWSASRVLGGLVTLNVAPATLVVENSFVSSVGWVKPGEGYPFRVFVKNYSASAKTGAVVTLPPTDGTTYVQARPVTGSGTATIKKDGSVSWTVGGVPARTDAGPGLMTLVVEARADTLQQDPQIVWKDISSTANLAYTGGPPGLTDTAHGPKVIPPGQAFDTARYGDRPFPVVPVDFRDRTHETAHSGERLLAVINSPEVKGSTFNLYQEMSYGQLFPHGTVPSAAIAQAGWDNPDGFQFTTPSPGGACLGTTTGAAYNTPLTPDRIRNGWYQLPGDTYYYGGDPQTQVPITAYGATGQSPFAVAATLFIDSGCGPTGKAVFDAATIADPEIDYSDYDTDKDGVVDFFMMVFVGLGGNGASQFSSMPYDNIWPHSSSLEFYYPDQGPYEQDGYVSDDQLKDHQGRPLYYTDASASKMTTQQTTFPVYVRVGPYNVNPESAIERASVISHEYGHSLGLPDFYSVGARATYGDWNLMATDKSQNMDVFGKQDLGWLVPGVLPQGQTTVNGWRDSKANTHRIDWVQPDGTPYTLTGPRVNNGEAYVAKLPPRILIEPKNFEESPDPVDPPFVKGSGDHAWWSQSGNGFGCAPEGAHNIDIYLPELSSLPSGTPVTLTFKSKWDIEWDYDYGFVMVSTDGGQTYTSVASQKGYTTQKEINPNANACQLKYGNGITGTSGSFAASTQAIDRLPEVGGYPEGGFLPDQYDLSSFAGQGTPGGTVLRFSYATDPGLARPGWFIDDVTVTAGSQVLYSSGFENGADESQVYNGGCKETVAVAFNCTSGWEYVSASAGSPADHAYYLELRDRSGYDFNGKGMNDRAPLAFLPGLLLTYTNEAHGYGNVGNDGPPAQSPLDANPDPGVTTPNLNDAAFTAGGVKRFSDSGTGWVDNYTDPSRPDARWRFDFNCLTFDVLGMSGDDIGPDSSPGNLQADVAFTVGSGCAPYDYGFGTAANFAPIAVAQAKPTSTKVNRAVRFDGSSSSDDRQAAGQLTYAWDFEGDGTYDASGATARHAYTTPGTYRATLKVTDAGGKSDTDTITIEVRSN